MTPSELLGRILFRSNLTSIYVKALKRLLNFADRISSQNFSRAKSLLSNAAAMKLIHFAAFLSFLVYGQATQAQENIKLMIRDVIERPALLYDADSSSAVVLVPQSGLKADSWKVLALQLKSRELTSLALNSTSEEDIGAAVQYLLAKGVKHISLMGGSIGGASVLRVLNKNKFPQVNRAIFLGTGAGDASNSKDVDKLFIVAKHDAFASETHVSHRRASEPKRLIIFPGNLHGQALFDSPHKEELEKVVINFLTQ